MIVYIDSSFKSLLFNTDFELKQPLWLPSGNSASQAIELLIQKGVPEFHIIFLNLISVGNNFLC